MDEQDEIIYRRRRGKLWTGLFIILIGCILLLDQMRFPLPDWLFNWHILLVAVGLFIGLRHNFRGGFWFLLIMVGGFLLVEDYYPDYHLSRFIWPIVLMTVGLLIILKPSRSRFRRHWGGEWGHEWREEFENRRREHHRRAQQWRQQGPNQTVGAGQESYSSEDFLDATSIFGGVHKKVVSKNFKGGDITTIMGGSEIDLTQADFTGTVRLEITQVMGGSKIIVPAHWEVRTEVSAILAGFEDKRQQPAVINPEKVLIIDGTSVLGGIEVVNY